MSKQRILIQNARLIDPSTQLDTHEDIFIADGKIIAIGPSPEGFTPDCLIDAERQIVCPGLVDLSVRLGNIETELAAAVAGGVTSLACPPDAHPVLDEPGLVERLVRRSEKHGLSHVYPIGALTQQLAGEKLAEMDSLSHAGCVAFSQASRPLLNTEVLMRAMQYAATFGYQVICYPQDYFLSRNGIAHNGKVASRLGLPPIPVSAETIAVATALLLAEETGVRIHLAHLSSAEGIALVHRAQQKGMQITCDITINHLHLTEEAIGFFDSHARLEPPLRTQEDRFSLRDATVQGIAVICSDHTPVDEDGKQLPFAEALPGSTGLELLLPLTLKWAKEESLPLCQALARITSDPAKILGIRAGTLQAGSMADLCIFDPEQRWTVTRQALISRGKNTPFMDKELTGRVQTTIIAGEVVHQLRP